MTSHYLKRVIEEIACFGEMNFAPFQKEFNSSRVCSEISVLSKSSWKQCVSCKSMGVTETVFLKSPLERSSLLPSKEMQRSYCSTISSKRPCKIRETVRIASLWLENLVPSQNSHSTKISNLINDFAIANQWLMKLRFRTFWVHHQGSALVTTERPRTTTWEKENRKKFDTKETMQLNRK